MDLQKATVKEIAEELVRRKQPMVLCAVVVSRTAKKAARSV